MHRAQLTCLALLLSLLGPAPAEETVAMTDGALVRALRAGGFNIYFRHAETDWSQSDRVREAGDWVSCDPARIRQLSEAGRETARAVGGAIRALRIPVGLVLASPYCRTVQTAELLGVGAVQPTVDVMNLRVAEYFGGRAAIVRTARARLATAPLAGTNTVIAAHGNVAREATPVYPGEAEGVVFKPDGRGGFRVVARLRPEDWARLAEQFAAPSGL